MTMTFLAFGVPVWIFAVVTGVRVGTERVRGIGFGTSEDTGSWVSGMTSPVSSSSRPPRTLDSRLGGESGTLNVEMRLDLVCGGESGTLNVEMRLDLVSLRGGESGTKKGNPSEVEDTGVVPVVEVRGLLTTGGSESLVDRVLCSVVVGTVVVGTAEDRTNCSLGRIGPRRRGSSGNSSISSTRAGSWVKTGVVFGFACRFRVRDG
ncbi:hypothetical protein Aple_099940 [Acrocarpospora pleiomorpha]|uniref:Uncharacterized protein n=2 Tax=Acrocarpospora pleiomorpha TaxID=90975 RepID=A0A5M3Y194_9ACTN|nr:hypothetical protein Aple_099940 [Acrocarpospora pleiomorpha]